MNDLTNISNEDLGLFIKLSLTHGVNTQFSYELLYAVAERLITDDVDEYFESVWSEGFDSGYARCKSDMGEHFDDVAETLDTILAEGITEDNKETVEILTDIESYEAMDKAVKEAFEEEPVEEAPVKKEPKKKEKPTVKESLTVETLQPVEIVEETPSITAEALKTKALEMRQKNTISRDAITAKLAEYGATTILKLDPTVYNEFNAFLESHNV